ncbi:alkene reductase [Bartonella sp. HY406]|uniref:alkene reductase n=1 Tax=Bartonella sp. HY406 TaxID=2979331 RepID=UPI0021C6C2A7|nr:alkene reductase [Bartonella sp. HY406]UXN02982.1 alkene reductase [Bartonella sp. HY406]
MRNFLTKIRYGSTTASNSLVMAPMTRCRALDDGCATEIMAEYYAQRASAGLIISEGIQPCLIGKGFMNTPGLYSQEQVEAWKNVTHSVHQKNGKIFAQLMHSGRIGHHLNYSEQLQPIAPSAVCAQGKIYTTEGLKSFEIPKEMDSTDITQAIVDHVTAAKNAILAGFDGVEIHCGNGFLIHQFMAENTNLRSDDYGKDITGRLKFALEVIHQCSVAIGADKVGIRISPENRYNDIDEGNSKTLYQTFIPLIPKDLAYIHIMESNNREMTKLIRGLWNGVVILNPHESVELWPSTVQTLNDTLSSKIADAVSMGTLFISNPDLVDRIRTGYGLNSPKDEYFYTGSALGYTDYPTM